MKRELLGNWLNRETVERLCNKGWIIERAKFIYKRKVNIVADVEIPIGEKQYLVVVKNFGWRNSQSRLFSPFMRSRARKSWDASNLLLENGVIVPTPITCYTERKKGFIKKNFLLTERIDDYRLARKVLRDFTVESAYKDSVIRSIAEIVFKIHCLKYLHNDLTLGNFLVKNRNSQNVCLIDLNRMASRRFMTTFRKMYDISKMNLCDCGLVKPHENCRWIEFLNYYEPAHVKRNMKALQKAIRKNLRRHKVKALKKEFLRDESD
ncbi:MAG: lipopolysaccharide kinase InaA family protein [Candidatus Marinimicrobia bacterium]|nr:lipopolysaccharide kinase InaA family protein [Candidatus Neomarinimicrobiota bacterium]